jgi:hypothetical protein
MTLLVIKNILYRLLLQSKRRIECCTYNDTSNSSQTTLVSKINTHDSAVQRGGAVNTQATLIAVLQQFEQGVQRGRTDTPANPL